MNCRVKAIWFVMAAVALAAAPATSRGEDTDYLLDDAKISGREIHAFNDGNEPVLVVLDNFKLTVGSHTVTARDAVVWVKEQKFGPAVRHDITVYAEGGVRVTAPGEASAVDETILLTLRQQGEVVVNGVMSDKPLNDFPLYQRGKDASSNSQRVAAATTMAAQEQKPLPPELRIEPKTEQSVMTVSEPSQSAPAGQQPIPLVTDLGSPTASQPAKNGGSAVKPEPAEKPEPTDAAGRKTAAKPPEPPAFVTFRADRVTWREVGDRRIGIAKGGVYLSRGQASSQEFLEMQAQTAVVFSGKTGEKDVRSPYSPRLPGAASSLPGAKGQQERITGVYLEGDVAIRRGERYVRGPAAYYDFTTDRAIMPNAVFRTIQAQRNIPIYIRADEFRALSAREAYFKNARVTTSDFYTPNYHVGASRVYLMDATEYDAKGVRISQQKWESKLYNTTFNVAGVPILYAPLLQGDLTNANTALRSVQVGEDGRLGFGVQTEWDLFRLLGLLQPEGYRGRVELSWYEKGLIAGATMKYAKQLANRQYSGYWELYGVRDDEKKDEFGDERDNIPAPEWRGRILARHKELLPKDWTVQFELSAISDRNFLEEFFPNEFHAGKEQETLVYARKQRDNWAFTALGQYRLNRFQTQTESYPDLGLYLIGEPLWHNNVLLYSESHAGIKDFVPANYTHTDDSGSFARLDTRQEINVPQHFGAYNVLPYATGRMTYWGKETDQTWITDPAAQTVTPGTAVQGETFRPFGEVGVKTDTNFSRVYDNVQSRVWDVHRLRHIITPEATIFGGTTGGVEPKELYPIDPDIEEHLGDLYGVAFGATQRLQTKRGLPGKEHSVDWMRFAVIAGFYGGDLSGDDSGQPADGRFYSYRPEYSIGRDHVNFNYEWNISDATAFLADANYDVETSSFRRADAGFAVQRDPRLRYYLGIRWIEDLNSSVGTFGVDYEINRKYSVSFFEQYDFLFHDGDNLATAITLTRKFPRWYVAVGFLYDAGLDDIMLTFSVWPEGVPELRMGNNHTNFLSRSDKN